MIAALAFYVFAAVLLASAVMVVTSRNPVHSVLFLILAFFNASGLFLLAGAEFLAMILVIVYVGAVAVLFLFVVMMLDVNFIQLREGFQKYAPVGAVVGLVLFAELIFALGSWQSSAMSASLLASRTPGGISNTAALGRLIYTEYIFLFQASGLVLLVAMIGAIVLTLRDRQTSRHQSIAAQVARNPGNTLELVSVAVGANMTETGIYRPKPAEVAPSHGHDPHGHDAHGQDAHDDHHGGGH